MRLLFKPQTDNSGPMEVKAYEAYPEFDLPRHPEEEPEEGAEEVGQEDVLEQSVIQAEKIMETARQEAGAVREKAYEEGYEKGVGEGYEEGIRRAMEENRQRYDEELGKLQDSIRRYIEDVEHEKEKVLEQYLEDLKNISLTIGEKIVQISLRSSGEVVERMILAATERLKKCAWAKIYIGQNGEKMDVRGDEKFLNELSKLSDNVKIVVMDAAEPGTCIVELPDEIIDISVGTQLENIKEILNNARL